MSVVGTIIVLANTINMVAEGARTVMTAINNIKNAINTIRSVDLQNVWKSQKNTDSKVFYDKMAELEDDIQRAYDILDQYEQLLKRSAKQYEETQQQVYDSASSLKSPRGR